MLGRYQAEESGFDSASALLCLQRLCMRFVETLVILHLIINESLKSLSSLFVSMYIVVVVTV